MNVCHALTQRVAALAISWRIRRGLRAANARDRAFAAYFREITAALREAPSTLTVESNREAGGPREISLRLPAGFSADPGDLLYVFWKNPPETVAEVRSLLGTPPRESFRVWSYGFGIRPTRRIEVTAAALLSEILDLEEPSPALLHQARRHATTPLEQNRLVDFLRAHPAVATWPSLIRHQTRATPRLYTISRPPGANAPASLDLLVSPITRPRRDGTSGAGRCSAYLTTLVPGSEISAYRMAHPHRLPSAHGHPGPGFVVVTGSAIAGLLAFLTTDAPLPPLWVIWGVRDRSLVATHLAILETARASGKISRLDLAESRPSDGAPARHVQDVLLEAREEVKVWIAADAWFYISGHRSMAKSIRQTVREILESQSTPREADAQWHEWQDSLRYIESASG